MDTLQAAQAEEKVNGQAAYSSVTGAATPYASQPWGARQARNAVAEAAGNSMAGGEHEGGHEV